MNAYDQFINDKNLDTQATSSSDPYSAFINQDIPNTSDITTANQLASKPDVSKYNGYCQGFVDDALGTPPEARQPSASAAWTNYSQTGQAVQGTQGMQPGDMIYFNDPNDPDGHVGFFAGGNKFISATEEDPNKPVQTHSIKGWEDLTGQQILGYVKNPSNLPSIGGNQ